MRFEFPDPPPGIHPPTAALTRILKLNNVVNPLTNQPYSEAFLLGVGGGLSAGYILFQFEHLPNPMLRLGFRNRWNNSRAFLKNLSDRLHLRVQFKEFEKRNTAQIALQEIIKQNKLAIVWVDKAFLPYYGMPDNLKGFFSHQVTVYARDGRLWRLYLDDLSSQPLEIREKVFTAARANLSQNNYLMMVFRKARKITVPALREAITCGIQDSADQLTQPLKTLGISTLETWAERLADRYDHQGWPQVFKDPKGLFPVLQRIYESITLDGTGGFALRKIYSDFLQESASYLNNPGLNAVAGQYIQLSNHWANLAENALSSKVLVFDHVKHLLKMKYEAYRESDFKSYRKLNKDLQVLEAQIITEFPLEKTEIFQLFKRLSRQVKLIAELETSAAFRLRDVIRQ